MGVFFRLKIRIGGASHGDKWCDTLDFLTGHVEEVVPVGPQLDYAELMSGEHGLDEYLRFSVSIGAVTSSR